MNNLKVNGNNFDKMIEDTLNEMTLDEEIYVMSGHHFVRHVITDMKFRVRVYHGGGVKRLNIPPFLFTDGPRGVIMPGSTCFPIPMARGATWGSNNKKLLSVKITI